MTVHLLYRVLRPAVPLRPDEAPALVCAFLYFFALLSSYYVLRPLRDAMGVTAGVEHLQWLFTATFFAMLGASPLFGWLVSRVPRRRLVPMTYRVFSLNILLFFIWLTAAEDHVLPARVFFVWVSVFNLFVVSVFWSVMADLFWREQAKRLFGFIAAGGSAGAIAGPALTSTLAVPLGPVNLLLLSALLLELAILCVRILLRTAPGRDGGTAPGHDGAGSGGSGRRGTAGGSRGASGIGTGGALFEDSSGGGRCGAPTGGSGAIGSRAAVGGGAWGGTADPRAAEAPIGGTVLAGFGAILRSPYLSGIALFMLLYTTTSTFLYFQQATLVAAASADPGERTRIFALIDTAVGVLTLLLQSFATGRVMRWAGLAPCLAAAPLATLAGFCAVAAAPAVAVVAIVQAVRRAIDFALTNPARQALFTVVDREARYKSKNVLDTVVYRGGDMASGWLYAGLTSAGLAVAGTALAALPLSAAWILIGALLGRSAEARVTERRGDAHDES